MINFSNFCSPSIKVIRFACLIFAVFTFTNLEAQIDAKATKETKSLLQFLKLSSKNGTAFGYQTPTSMGRGWTSDNAKNLKSDMELATGYKPAIYGFDFKKWNFNLKQRLDDRSRTSKRNLSSEVLSLILGMLKIQLQEKTQKIMKLVI